MATTATTLDTDRLGIYLNDHLGGAATGLELAKRLAADNRDLEIGPALARLAQEIEEDRDTLKGLMERLGIGESALKVAGGWLAEKAQRLKPDDSTEYGPVDRFIDLETLTLGVTRRLALWRALCEVREIDPRLANADLSGLADRADRQREELDRYRLAAAREAFTGA